MKITSAAICIWATLICTSDASDFAALTAKIPRGANAILLIDVDGALASPIATANSWKGTLQKEAADRPMYLPPEADKIIVAAQLDEVRGFSRIWQAALMGLKEQMPMSLIARAEGGYADTVNGVDVAWVPSDAYFINVDSNTLGLLAPANRQAISRWADHAKSGTRETVSEYLRIAIAEATGGPQFVMAIDTADALQPHRIGPRLEQSEYIKSKQLNVAELTSLMMSLQGVVLKVTLTDKIGASARIDFTDKVSLKGDDAKSLVLEALQTMQMELPDVQKWTCSVGTTFILLEGELSNNGLRRLMSLMEIPTTKFSSLKDAKIDNPSQDDASTNSVAYFKTIDSLLKDLREKSKSSSSDAYWIDRYAAKIDNLPILHVDDDLLEYGQNLSATLRVMSGTRKTTNLQGGVASRENLSQGNNFGYGYNSYGYSTPKSRETAAGNSRENAAASRTATKIQGWNLIDEATVKIRQEMTKRYNVEF